MAELFANNYVTTLSGGITNVATTVVMAGAVPAALQAAGQWRLLIDNELMLVTAVALDNVTLTVTRGIEGTSNVSHSNGANAVHIFTTGALNQFRADSLATGSYASRPTAAIPGRLYLPNDGQVVTLDSGAAWAAWGPLVPMVPVVAANFSWVDQGSATETVAGGVAFLQDPGGQGANDAIRLRVQASPGATHTITLAMLLVGTPGANHQTGAIVLRNSSSGKLYIFGISINASNFTPIQIIASYNSATSYNTRLISDAQSSFFGVIWLRIQDDGTHRTYYQSTDGLNFVQVAQEASGAWIVPDQVGYALNNFNSSAGQIGAMSVLSFKATSP